MANIKLSEAKRAKNDEFYTQYQDIKKEISAYLEYDPDVFRGINDWLSASITSQNSFGYLKKQ